MSLSAREQHALDSIKEGLARSDPQLATLLATFTELVCGEDMPMCETIHAGSWRALGHRRRRPTSKSHRHAGSMHQRPGLQGAALLMLITATLIVIGVVFGRSGGAIKCPSLVPVPCVSSAAAHGSRHAAHTEHATQARDQQVRTWPMDVWGAHG